MATTGNSAIHTHDIMSSEDDRPRRTHKYSDVTDLTTLPGHEKAVRHKIGGSGGIYMNETMLHINERYDNFDSRANNERQKSFYGADERDFDHLRIYDTVGNEKQYQDSRDERYYRDCDSEQQRVHYLDNKHTSDQRRNIVNSNDILNSYPVNTHSSDQRRNIVNSNDILNSYPVNTHSSDQRRNIVNSTEIQNSYPVNTHSSDQRRNIGNSNEILNSKHSTAQRRDLITSDVILTNHPGNQHVMFGCHDNANSDDLMCDSDEVSEINYRNLPDPLIQLPKGKTSTCDKKPVEWKVGRIQPSLIDFENLSLWTDENAENKRAPDRRGNDRRTSGYLTMSNLDRDGLVAQQHKHLQYSDRDECEAKPCAEYSYGVSQVNPGLMLSKPERFERRRLIPDDAEYELYDDNNILSKRQGEVKLVNKREPVDATIKYRVLSRPECSEPAGREKNEIKYGVNRNEHHLIPIDREHFERRSLANDNREFERFDDNISLKGQDEPKLMNKGTATRVINREGLPRNNSCRYRDIERKLPSVEFGHKYRKGDSLELPRRYVYDRDETDCDINYRANKQRKSDPPVLPSRRIDVSKNYNCDNNRLPITSRRSKQRRNQRHCSFASDSESDCPESGRENKYAASPSTRKRNSKEWIKLERYDGSTSLDTYLAHFQNCNDYNRWNEADRVAHLRASLFGNAAQVLWGLPAHEMTFSSLTQKLTQRFGCAGQTAKYRAELRARRRGKAETLQSLYQDIRRLLVLAYPGDSSPSAEAIAMETFLQALDDKEFELRLCEKEFESLDELFRHALRMEANDKAIHSRHDTKRNGGNQVRGLANDSPLEQIATKLEQVMASQQRSEKNLKQLERDYEQLKSKVDRPIFPKESRNRDHELDDDGSRGTQRPSYNQPRPSRYTNNGGCFNCGRPGHRAAHCRGPRIERTDNHNGRNADNSRRSTNMGAMEEPPSQTPGRVGGIEGDAQRGSEVYLTMMLNGRPHKCLLDTGCEMSIVPRSVVVGLELEPSNLKMKAANGTEILVNGKTVLDFELGPLRLSTDVLVSDHVYEVMLGYDWLRKNKVAWDFANLNVVIDNLTFQLSSRDGPRWCRRVEVQVDTVVPPRCEMDVAGKLVMRNFTTADAWMTEAKEIETGLCSSRTIIPDQCNDIPVRILNVMDKPVSLKAGSILSKLDKVEVIESQCHLMETADLSYLDSMLHKVDPSVPHEIREGLTRLVHRYHHIFSRDEYDLGRAHTVQHHVNTGDAKPFRQTLRRQPDKYLDIIDEQVELMKKQGLIEEAQSDWASNVVLAKKKDGSLRFCVDYRQSNLRTVKDTYPLPLIGSCLDALGGSKYFSTFDLRSGYHQVMLAPEDADKTTFLTRRGAFKFKVMPFGLTAAPATFQRLMDAVMSGVNFSICLIYLDDIIVFSKSLEEHLERLEIIFKRLETVNLKLKPSKCCLLKREVNFLGHTVSSEGIGADPEKSRSIEQWPEPRSIKDIRIFLGLCSYYRKLVKDFAQKAAPMYELLKKNRRFEWTSECHQSFLTLKSCLTHPPILSMPIDDGQYILDTDCSGQAAGAVLSQVQNGEEKVIAYASRSLSKSEKNYCITRQELLSVVFFVKYFRCYLLGRQFKLRTDHAALRWLRSTPEPIGQQSRWLEILEEFSFDIEHRPGRLHTNADAMSRMPCRQCGMETDLSSRSIQMLETDQAANESHRPTLDRWSDEIVAEATRQDPDWWYSIVGNRAYQNGPIMILWPNTTNPRKSIGDNGTESS